MKLGAGVPQLILAAVVTLMGAAGCGGSNSPPSAAEGTLYTVVFQTSPNHFEGITRSSHAAAITISMSGMSGSSNLGVDCTGRLTSEFLFVTYPKSGRPMLVIPVSRILRLEFGDGGIKKVGDDKPRPTSTN